MTNKRIAELREQAFELCKKYDDDCGSDLVKTNEVFQKFAELIIRECRLAVNRIEVESSEASIALTMADAAIRDCLGEK
jgi:hypothetical protein